MCVNMFLSVFSCYGLVTSLIVMARVCQHVSLCVQLRRPGDVADCHGPCLSTCFSVFSCYGLVTSLNGDSESGVFVEAVGSGSCSGLQEESKTEQDGNFRIRGLQV